MLFSSVGYSQDFSRHKQTINEIYCDKKGTLYALDQQDELFRLHPTIGTFVKVSWHKDYELFKNVGESYMYKNSNVYHFGHEFSTVPLIYCDQRPLASAGHSFCYLNDEQFRCYSTKAQSGALMNGSCDLDTAALLRLRIINERPIALLPLELKDLKKQHSLAFDFVATDFVVVGKDTLISSADQGLVIVNEGQLKQFYIPGISFPRNIDKLELHNNNICIQDEAGRLFVYQYEHETLDFIDSEVTDFLFDNWDVLWYAKGRDVYSHKAYRNDSDPHLTLESINDLNIRNSDNLKEHSEDIRIGDKICLNFSHIYNPDPEAVVVEYALNNGPWEKWSSDDCIVPSRMGVLKIEYRAIVNGRATGAQQIMVYVGGKAWPWMLVGGTVLMFFAFLMIGVFKMNKEKKASERRRRDLEMKLSLLSSEQKFRQAQMNPHFVFNALNAVRGLVAMGENVLARKALTDLASFMRQQLEYSDNSSISLNQECEYITHYLELERMMQAQPYTYSVDFKADMQAMIAPMLIQPFIENAIIHGRFPHQDQAHIDIVLTEEDRYFKVIIEDNGPGFNPNEKTVKNEKKHRSMALDIFKERCLRLDKWKTREHLIYENRKDDGKGITGTRCILNIPKL